MHRSDFSRLCASVVAAARSPGEFARAAARLPLEREAAAKINRLPVIELADVIGRLDVASVALPNPDSRHGWSLGLAEQLVLQILIKARKCQTVFEIGTFNGGTTRMIADTLPRDGQVWTLDLPPSQFDETQSPVGLDSNSLGYAYHDSPAAAKVTQLLADSLSFDFTPYEDAIDLVLIDGGHGWEHGLSDTRAALHMIRRGGVILWDDFEPYWHGLVGGICKAMGDRKFGRLAGTSFAVHVADPAQVPPLS
jgi:predicted O-methyltransferase YrrM